jgi:hypothetical protein
MTPEQPLNEQQWALLQNFLKGYKPTTNREQLLATLPLLMEGEWSLEPVLISKRASDEQVRGFIKALAPSHYDIHVHLYGASEWSAIQPKGGGGDPHGVTYDRFKSNAIEVGRKGPAEADLIEGQIYYWKAQRTPVPENHKFVNVFDEDGNQVQIPRSESIVKYPEGTFYVKGIWSVYPAWRLTAPANQSVTFEVQDIDKMKPAKVYNWLYKKMDARERAKALVEELGGREAVEQSVKPVDPRTLEGTGTCPVCFRNIKLNTDNTMKRHGWNVQGQRQVGSYGVSWHTGPCIGVGYEPYELSPAGTVAAQKVVLRNIGSALDAWVNLQEKPELTIYKKTRLYGDEAKAYRKEHGIRGGMVYREDRVVLRPGDTSRLHPMQGDYETVWQSRNNSARGKLQHLKRDFEFLDGKIQDWEVRPLPGKAQ